MENALHTFLHVCVHTLLLSVACFPSMALPQRVLGISLENTRDIIDLFCHQFETCSIYGVFLNSGILESSILIEYSSINNPAIGVSPFRETSIYCSGLMYNPHFSSLGFDRIPIVGSTIPEWFYSHYPADRLLIDQQELLISEWFYRLYDQILDTYQIDKPLLF